MPRKSKTAAPSTSTTPVVVKQATSATPAKKSTKKSASATTKAAPTKAASTKAASTPVATVIGHECVVPVGSENIVVDTSSNELSSSFTEFSSRLTQMSSQFSAIRTEFRNLEKRWNRELRAAQKASAKKKRKTGNRQPSGFVKPTLISNELASFLGREHGSEMARTEVTREINKYIRAHQLQDKENGRKINPDSSLRTLLKVPTDEQLTYFNLQRYMSPHFAKMGQEHPWITAAAVAAAASK